MTGSDARQLERLLDAVLTIGSDLDLHTVLHTIIQTATEAVDATYGALGVLDDSRSRLVEFVTVGVDDDVRAAIGDLPEGHGILGLLIVEPKPLRLPDLTRHPASYGFPPNHPPMTSFLGAPVAVRGQVFGNVYLCDKVGGGAFTDDDEELVVNLASVASLAIENARLHARVAELATLEDRERIARDLHDTVIQRLFAIGLSLQATQRLVDDPVVASRLVSAVDDLDTTVRDIRAAIFELQVAHRSGASVRQQLLDLAAQSAPALHFDPVLRFDGPIDAAVESSLAEELLAVVREALANIARHAHASRAEVGVEVREQRLSLVVKDDGVGYSTERPHGHGITNLQARAARLGGQFTIAGTAGGTELRWAVPIRYTDR
jgi:signal transduction histidine kinase